VFDYDKRDMEEGHVGYYDFSQMMEMRLDADAYVAWKNVFDASIVYWNTTDKNYSMFKRMFSDFPTYKLEYLIKRLEVQGVNSHNAIDDVKATANLLFTLFKDKDQYFLDRANFLKENRNTVKAFRAKFKDFYKELLQQKDKDGTLAELFKQIGVFYGIETKAEVPRDIFKVLNFMNHISGKDNINTLLEKHIFDFTTYKESDLVTGKEKVIISTVHKSKR
jgi:hypothetical protein